MDNSLNALVGGHMRRLRNNKRLTLEEVALRMGYKSKNTLSRMELGIKQITVDDVMKFSGAIGISYIEFFETMANV